MKETTTAETAEYRNEVLLCGRVAAPADERELPSGDAIVSMRVIINRPAPGARRSTQRVDTIDCIAWTRRLQRSIRTWRAGDWVRVEGALRRRFFRTDSGPVSRFEIEVSRARRLSRARADAAPPRQR